jgi:adenine/guanine/hypoxanthine permease
MTMGLVANYPWVVSTQLGTNSYFVNNVLQPFTPCGAHATLTGDDAACGRVSCECKGDKSNPTAFTVPDTALASCANSTNVCLGTKVPYEQALTATFLEGLVFLFICFTGLRKHILKIFPKQVLLAGACGIGIFISFVGFKDSGFITQGPYPILLRLNLRNQYKGGPLIDLTYMDGPVWNDCDLYFGGAPFGLQCNWLALGGLIFTGILMIWNLNGAFIIGILFTTFISWAKFPDSLDAGGMVPTKFAGERSFFSFSFFLSCCCLAHGLIDRHPSFGQCNQKGGSKM